MSFRSPLFPAIFSLSPSNPNWQLTWHYRFILCPPSRSVGLPVLRCVPVVQCFWRELPFVGLGKVGRA